MKGSRLLFEAIVAGFLAIGATLFPAAADFGAGLPIGIAAADFIGAGFFAAGAAFAGAGIGFVGAGFAAVVTFWLAGIGLEAVWLAGGAGVFGAGFACDIAIMASEPDTTMFLIIRIFIRLLLLTSSPALPVRELLLQFLC
jgi:hypothetical protein